MTPSATLIDCNPTLIGGQWVDKENGVMDIELHEFDGSCVSIRLDMVDLLKVREMATLFLERYLKGFQSSMPSGMESRSALTPRSRSHCPLTRSLSACCGPRKGPLNCPSK